MTEEKQAKNGGNRVVIAKRTCPNTKVENLLESSLKDKSNSITYHSVRASEAAKIIYVVFETKKIKQRRYSILSHVVIRMEL